MRIWNTATHVGDQGRWVLIPNILCDHNLVVNNLLWPLWHQFGWILDCFNYSFCSCWGLLCPTTWIIYISYLLITLNMGVCSQMVYSGTNPQMPTWHLSLCSLGASNAKHVLLLLLIPIWEMFPNWFENLHDIQIQHILNIYNWNF